MAGISNIARSSEYEAQWRPCRIDTQALRSVDDWLESYRKLWEERFDRLDDYLKQLQDKEDSQNG